MGDTIYVMRIGFLLLLVGCNSAPAPNIRATDFDQTCTQATDCILIDEGAQCCTGCGSASINKKDQARYQEAAKQRAAACQGSQCPAINCVAGDVACTSGKCVLCGATNCADAGTVDASSDAPKD